MQVIVLTKEQLNTYIVDDPVRPHLSAEFRVQPSLGRFSYGLKNDSGDITAVMCVAKGRGIPTTESELERIGYEDAIGPVSVVPYTIWSYSPGAGRKLINEVISYIKNEYESGFISLRPRVVTMSPITDIAKKFHLRNGAVLLAENNESNNLEYNIFKN